MSDFGPVIPAITATLTLLAGVVGLVRVLARRQAGQPRGQITMVLRERLELAEAKNVALAERNAELEAENGHLERDLDTCARQRDDAWSELRGVNTRRVPRTPRT